jgi:hypothetical protein
MFSIIHGKSIPNISNNHTIHSMHETTIQRISAHTLFQSPLQISFIRLTIPQKTFANVSTACHIVSKAITINSVIIGRISVDSISLKSSRIGVKIGSNLFQTSETVLKIVLKQFIIAFVIDSKVGCNLSRVSLTKSLNHQKFVVYATHKAVIAPITTRIGRDIHAIAVQIDARTGQAQVIIDPIALNHSESGHKALHKYHIPAINHDIAVATHTIPQTRFGFSCTNHAIRVIIGVIASLRVAIAGNSALAMDSLISLRDL